jgi:hypothetical protein
MGVTIFVVGNVANFMSFGTARLPWFSTHSLVRGEHWVVSAAVRQRDERGAARSAQ